MHNIVGARKQTRGDYQSIVQVSGPAAWNLEKRSEQPAEHRQDRNELRHHTATSFSSLSYVNRIPTDTMSSDKPVANADASGSDAADLAKVHSEQAPAPSISS